MYGTIECPYCGHERKGTWDDTENVPFEDIEFQCEKWFIVDCEVEVYFNFYSRKDD